MTLNEQKLSNTRALIVQVEDKLAMLRQLEKTQEMDCIMENDQRLREECGCQTTHNVELRGRAL